MATKSRSYRRWGVASVFRIVGEPIDPNALERIACAGDGAVVTFLGIVRGRSDDGKAVSALFYEAFEPMALSEFQTIAGDARERFGDLRLAIVHRVGLLRVGEVSIAVVAAAPHRGVAFDACRFAIEQVKRRAPIWKKEHYVDGVAQWRTNAPA
jgi:molybdopterin synthase catalytic subunit